MTTTAENRAASENGRLRQMANKANELTLGRKLLELMKMEKVASPDIERQAWWLGRKKGGKRREAEETIGFNFKGNRYKAHFKGKDFLDQERSWPRVLDAIDLNLKYCKREERRVKEEYRQMKRRIVMRAKGNKTKERNVSRLLQSIAQTTQDRWSKGMEKNRNIISWWKKKLVSQKKQTKQTSRQN